MAPHFRLSRQGRRSGVHGTGVFARGSSHPCQSERREHDRKELVIIHPQGPAPYDILPPGRPFLLEVPKPPEIPLITGDQVFKHMNLWESILNLNHSKKEEELTTPDILKTANTKHHTHTHRIRVRDWVERQSLPSSLKFLPVKV